MEKAVVKFNTRYEAGKSEANELYKAGTYAAAIDKYSALVDLLAAYAFPEDAGAPRLPADAVERLCVLLSNRSMAAGKMGDSRSSLHDATGAVHLLHHGFDLEFQRDYRPVFRRLQGDICFKSYSRRAAAFEMLGNTAAAAQCMSALVAAEPHAGPLPDLGREAARTWVTYSSLSHPDTRRLRAMKLNWSLTVPGVWSRVQTAGATPTARRYFSAAHYDGKVFIFGGESSCSSMWPRIGVQALDLATKNWSAVQCSGPEPARHFSFGQYNCQMSSAVWKHVMLVYLGGCTLWSLNLQSLAWVAHSLSMRGTMRPGYEHEGIFFTEHAMCVSGDSVYVFGGQIGGVDTDVLAAIDLNTFSMEVLHRSSLLCRSAPEPRHGHQMWASGRKVYILGGFVNTGSGCDHTYSQERYFWSWDIADKQWVNESEYKVDKKSSNLPASRGEFPVAAAEGHAYIFGGYSTAIKGYRPGSTSQAATVGEGVYLGDSFWFDSATGVWKMIHCDDAPPPRAGAALVYVPPSPADGSSRSKSKGKANGKDKEGSEKGKDKEALSEGSFLMIGGYNATADYMDVWELKVGKGFKHVEATCHGCENVGRRFKQCMGGCGGAQLMCSADCQRKAWNEHKLWCRAK